MDALGASSGIDFGNMNPMMMMMQMCMQAAANGAHGFADPQTQIVKGLRLLVLGVGGYSAHGVAGGQGGGAAAVGGGGGENDVESGEDEEADEEVDNNLFGSPVVKGKPSCATGCDQAGSPFSKMMLDIGAGSKGEIGGGSGAGKAKAKAMAMKAMKAKAKAKPKASAASTGAEGKPKAKAKAKGGGKGPGGTGGGASKKKLLLGCGKCRGSPKVGVPNQTQHGLVKRRRDGSSRPTRMWRRCPIAPVRRIFASGGVYAFLNFSPGVRPVQAGVVQRTSVAEEVTIKHRLG